MNNPTTITIITSSNSSYITLKALNYLLCQVVQG
jgi:hypothetical protein